MNLFIFTRCAGFDAFSCPG